MVRKKWLGGMGLPEYPDMPTVSPPPPWRSLKVRIPGEDALKLDRIRVLHHTTQDAIMQLAVRHLLEAVERDPSVLDTLPRRRQR